MRASTATLLLLAALLGGAQAGESKAALLACLVLPGALDCSLEPVR